MIDLSNIVEVLASEEIFNGNVFIRDQFSEQKFKGITEKYRNYAWIDQMYDSSLDTVSFKGQDEFSAIARSRYRVFASFKQGVDTNKAMFQLVSLLSEYMEISSTCGVSELAYRQANLSDGNEEGLRRSDVKFISISGYIEQSIYFNSCNSICEESC